MNKHLILVLLGVFVSACIHTQGDIDASVQNRAFSNSISRGVQGPHEWPSFHGPDRSNKSKETGLMNSWPEDGPDLLWTISGLGEGYASISIAEGLIYTSGTHENQTFVFAFDMNGKPVWKKPNGPAWKVEVYWARGYDGSRSTPTYDDGIVYHLSEAGRLSAYHARDGEEIWSRDIMDEFMAEMPDYGFTESVLVDGNYLFVRPGGRKGFQVCLNKMTGETIWTNNDIPGTNSYVSSILHEFGGHRQIIGASSTCYYGMNTKTGKLLWKFDFENMYEVNCTDAVTHNEYVILSSGERGGSVLVRLKSSGSSISAEKIWHTELMDNYHGGIIVHNGQIYGSGDKRRGWFSIDLLTGEQMWRSPGSMGSLTFADGMLYLYDEKGAMRLVKATPDQYLQSGEFEVPSGGAGPYWAHPVVCSGRLYLRHADNLYAYDIGKN